jgi:hypothetical protein
MPRSAHTTHTPNTAAESAEAAAHNEPQVRAMLPPPVVALAQLRSSERAIGGGGGGASNAAAVAATRATATVWRTPHTEALVQRVLSSLEQLARRNTKRYLAAPARSARKSAALPPEAAAFVGRFNPATDAEPVTAFHSAAVPEAPLATVAATLQRGLHRHLDHTTCLMAVVLVRRFEAATKLPVTLHMMHRLYLAALLVALKCHADRPLEPTRTFAVLCSMPAAELSRMEALLLQGIEYRATVLPLEVETLIEDYGGPLAQRTPFADPETAPSSSVSDAGSMIVSSDTDRSFGDDGDSDTSSPPGSCADYHAASLPTNTTYTNTTTSNSTGELVAAEGQRCDGDSFTSNGTDDTQPPTPTFVGAADGPARPTNGAVADIHRRGSAIQNEGAAAPNPTPM